MENPELPFKLVFPLARAHVHVARNRLEQFVDKAIQRHDSETGKDRHRYQREQDRFTIERLEREKLEATQRLGECRRNRMATSEQLAQSQRELADAEQRLGDSRRHREADMQNLVELRRQVAKDESTISGLKSAASQSAEQAGMARAEFEQCRARNAMAEESLRQKERDLRACMAERDRLQRLGKNLRASIKADKDALLQSKAEVARLQSETNTFRDKYKSCEETVADNKKAAEVLQAELAAKQEEIETLVREAGGHGTDFSRLRQEMSQLEAKCSETAAALQQSESSRTRCYTQLASLETSLREAHARQATLEKLKRHHEKTIKNVKAREEELARQLGECTRREQTIIEQLRQSRVELDGARRTVADLKRDREADMQNLVNLRRQANKDKAGALKELERCRAGKAAAEKSLQATIAKREELKRLADNLRASIEKDKAALQKTELEVARLRRECTKLLEKYETCRAEKKAVEDMAAATQKAVEDLQAQLVYKQEEIDLAAEKHGTISSQLKREMSELQAKHAQTIADLGKSRQNATESDNALALCREQLVKVETSLAATQAREKSLEKVKQHHEKTIKKVKAREDELARELGECRRREQTTIEQLRQREREVGELKRNLGELSHQAMNDQATISGLEGEARRSADRAAAALAKFDECSASKEAANTSLAEKEGELEACIAEKNEANGLADKLRESIQANQAAGQKLVAENKRLQIETDSLRSQLMSCKAATKLWEERDADKETTIQGLKEEIEGLTRGAGDQGAAIAQLTQQLTELQEAHAKTGDDLLESRQRETECKALLELSTDELERVKAELEKVRAEEAELRKLTVQQKQTIEACETRAKKAETELETAKKAHEETKISMAEKTQLLQTALEKLTACERTKDILYDDIVNTRRLANAVLTETTDESFKTILDRIGGTHGAFKNDMVALRKKIKDLRARLATNDPRVSELQEELQKCQDQARAEKERLEGERDAAMKKLADESNDVQVMIEMADEVVGNFDSADETGIDTLGKRLRIDRSSFVDRMKSLRNKIGELLFDMHKRGDTLEECKKKLENAVAEVLKLRQEATDLKARMESEHLAIVRRHQKELAEIKEKHERISKEKDKRIQSLTEIATSAMETVRAYKEKLEELSATLIALQSELENARGQGAKRESDLKAERDACLASKQLVEAKIRFMGDQVDLLQAARQLFTQTLDNQQQTARDSLLPRIRELRSRVEQARTGDDTLDGVLGSLDQLQSDLVSAPTERGAARREEEDINETISRLMHRAQRDSVVSDDLQAAVTTFRNQLHESFRQSHQVFAQRVALKKEFEKILEGFDTGIAKRVKHSAFDFGKLFVWM